MAVPTGAVAAKTVVTLGTWFGDSDWQNRYGAQMAGLAKALPDIELKKAQQLDWGTFADKVLLLAGSGSLPDILQVPPEQVAALVNAGILLDLEPMIRNDRSLDQRTWLPSAIAATHYKGITFGVPAYVVNYTYGYNKEILASRGIVPPGIDQWLTWDQVRDIAKKTTIDNNSDGLVDVWGYMQGWGYGHILPLVYQAGGHVLDDDGLVRFDTAPVHDAVDWLVSLIRDGIHPKPDDTYRQTFYQGKIAGMWLGSWEINSLVKAKTPVGVAAGEMQQRKDGVVYVTTFAITKNAKNKDAAWRVLKWLTSKEGQRYVPPRGLVPMRRDVSLPPDTREILTGFINELASARSFPYHVYSARIMQAYKKAMGPVWTLNKTPEQVLPELERTTNAYLRAQ